MTKTTLITALTALLALGAAGTAVAGTAADEFTGRTVTMMDSQVAVVGFGQSLLDPATRTAYMKVGKIETPGAPTLYALSVFISGQKFLFQDHLYVKADDLVFDTEAETKDRDVLSGGSITESSLYSVTAEQLRRLAAAGDVRIRVQGSRGRMENSLKPKALKKLRAWIEANVD